MDDKLHFSGKHWILPAYEVKGTESFSLKTEWLSYCYHQNLGYLHPGGDLNLE
jgi:hypothetical protein